MAKENAPEQPDTVERGDIFFFYRPKVNTEEPAGLDDVGRFHVVLRRQGGRLFRLLTIGRKRLPDIESHEREWGFVDDVTDRAEDIGAALRESTYETKTRGTRTRPPARPAGEGGYALVREGRQLHLAYALELPERPGPVQEELNIAPAASFIIAVSNPKAPNPPGLLHGEEAHFPKDVQKEFAGRRFAGEDPHMLDFERAEFVLIGARQDPEGELGVELGSEGRPPDAGAVLGRLKLGKRETAIEPLLRGEWA